MRTALVLALSCLLATPALAQKLTVEPPGAAESAKAEWYSARNGQVSAQLSLARRHQTGDGVARNPDLAADYLAAAAMSDPARGLPALRAHAASGNVRAQALLGRLLLSDAAAAQRAEGLRLLVAAADAGSADANFILGTRLAGSGAATDRREALVRLARAEKAGGKLGGFARFLRGTLREAARRPIDARLTPTAPIVWDASFDRGATGLADSLAYWGTTERDLGDQQTRRKLARARLFEIGEAAYSRDIVAEHLFVDEARRRCVDGAKIDRSACSAMIAGGDAIQGTALSHLRPRYADMPRMIEVAKSFELGVGGPADAALAHRIYEQLANGANPSTAEAAYRLSGMVERGAGGAADPAKARQLLRTAANEGHPMAAYAIALEKMRSGDMDDLGPYLKIAARGGNSDAAYYYARLLMDNKIGSRNRPKDIFDHLSQALAAGNKDAFYGMGMAHWQGWGVPVDEAKAEQWWERAARIGDPKAANHVAGLYLQRGDPAGAIPWLRRAAQGGAPGAKARLDEVLAKGWRERNLAGFLMSVFEFVGEVGEGMAMAYQAQYEREQAQIRQAMLTYVAPSGSSSSSSSGASSSSGSGDGESASSGESSAGAAEAGMSAAASDSAGGGDGSASGASGAGEGSFAGASGSNAGRASTGATGSGSGEFGGEGDGGDPRGLAQGSDPASTRGAGSDSGSELHGAIIVSSEAAERQQALIREAELRAIAAQAKAEADAARAQADHDRAVAEGEAKAARERAEYASRYAHCNQKGGASCVSEQ